ncbi:MAG: ATP-binding protein [Thermofilaceae archaeon]
MDLASYMLTKKESIQGLTVHDRELDVSESEHFIVAVVGPRRGGKTYFLYNLLRRRGLSDHEFVFLNFEEPVEVSSLDEVLAVHQEIYGVEPRYIFLDEIQALEGWERRVYALFERKRYRIFVTGSSSRLLSREVATQLRGRALPFYVYPFSLREVLRIYGIELKSYYSDYEGARIRSIASSCLKRGFFPDVVLDHVEPFRFYREFVDLIAYRDIIERYRVRNLYALELFLRSCISSNASLFSVHRLYNTLKSQGAKVSKKLLYSFQRMVEDSMFGFFLHKYARSTRIAALSMPKFYLVDNGVYAFHEGKNLGKLLENVVLLELAKRGYTLNTDVFYWRDERGYEVDFIIAEKGAVRELIQVSYATGEDEVERRELDALARCASAFKCDRLTIVTWSFEGKLEAEGRPVIAIPFWKWSLSLRSITNAVRTSRT